MVSGGLCQKDSDDLGKRSLLTDDTLWSLDSSVTAKILYLGMKNLRLTDGIRLNHIHLIATFCEQELLFLKKELVCTPM